MFGARAVTDVHDGAGTQGGQLLLAGHRVAVHQAQAFHRVGNLGRQPDTHGGDPVAAGGGIPWRSQADRCAAGQAGPRQFPPRPEEFAQGAGHHAHGDVVEGYPAHCAPDCDHLRHGPDCSADTAPTAHPGIETRPAAGNGWQVDKLLAGLPRPVQTGQQVAHGFRQFQLPPHVVQTNPRPQVPVAEPARGRWRLRVGLAGVPVQGVDDGGQGHAIDGGVVDLEHQRLAFGGQTRQFAQVVQQLHLPQRSRQVHAPAVQLRQSLAQPAPATSGQAALADMVCPVRALHPHPVGGVDVHQYPAQLAPEQRKMSQAAADQCLQAGPGQRVAPALAGGIEQHRGNVHGSAGAILVDEGGVES